MNLDQTFPLLGGKRATDIFPIYKVEHDCLVSAQGDITVAYEAVLPEIFSLSNEEYEAYHQAWIRALRVLPFHSILHKQDWYTQNQISAGCGQNSFLSRSAAKYFEGRPFLDHRCYILLTKKAKDRRLVSSTVSGLMRKSIVPRQVTDTGHLQLFLEKAGQFHRILSDSSLMSLRQMTDDDLAGTVLRPGVLEQYCFLQSQGELPLIRDVHVKDCLTVGDKEVQFFTLADAAELPAACGSRITYDKYSTDQTKFPVGFAAQLNLLLDCDHLFNQYIFIGDTQKTLKELEAKKRRLQSLSAYSRENALARDAVNDFLNEAVGHGRIPVKAHFNVMAWTENTEKIAGIRNLVSSAMAQLGANCKHETDGAPQLWWAGIPGNAADFPVNDTFDTFMEQAACFLNLEGNYRSDLPDTGIRLSDRLFGRPVYVDLFDAPRKAGLTSNMGTLVCGTSGGGKSMTVNHVLRTLYDQGAHCVTVDIGGSYKGLCELVGGYYFTYDEHDPIRFNPFYLPEGTDLDTEKKESLKALLVALWKQENENFNRSEYVALSNALQGYYTHNTAFPCFNGFYDYLEQHYTGVLKAQRVKDRDFDIDNFLYVLRPYYKGGEFDYLLNATENLDLLNQRFVVIELDQIKDHPILFPVVTLIVMELFLSKMRKLKGVRKVLTIDEAWKAIAKSGMAEFLRYAFKTIRKFNGVPIVITQELDDLVSSPIIKDAIINNADIKILMDMKKFLHKFDKLQDVLGLSDKGKTILLSVNKDNREIFIDIGGQSKVYKNELCPEEYYAFTTEGKERVRVQEYAAKYGSMEKGITMLAAENQKRS
ncbi:MAG: TraG family conjugative transposon ATPase [Mucilaginibacter sp.]